MNYELMTVDPTTLVVGGNTRVDAGLDVGGMANSVEERGVQTPLALWKRPDGKLEVVEGHRRLAGSLLALKRNPTAFKKFHPKGIPAYVRKDITSESEALTAKVDQGTQKALRYRSERDRAIGMLCDAGMSEKDIISQCEGLLAHFQATIPSPKRDKIASLRAAGAEKNRDEIRQLLHETYKGQYQTARAIWECPTIVRATMEFIECGQPHSFKKIPAKLTYSDVTKLVKALKEDCQIKDDSGIPVYSKAEPGPNFSRLFAEYLKAKPKVDGEKQAKAMSAKAMLNQLKSGAWASEGFKRLTLQHSGKTDVQGLNVADEMLHLAEIVSKLAPVRWTAFKADALTIKQAAADGTLVKG